MNIFDFEKKYKDILENIEKWAYIMVPLGHKLKNYDVSRRLNSKTSKVAGEFH